MELINTIEISPYDYANNEYASPNGRLSELPDEWNAFWLKCISDKNLGNLKAIKKGAYLADMDSIGEHELEEILKKELQEVELEEFEDQVSILSGGIAIKENNSVLIEPTCCGDIGNIVGWESIVETESKGWTQLWIGHPWIFYKKDNGFIEFSDYTNANLEDFEATKIVLTIAEVELKSALKKMRKQQNDFEANIRKTLDKMGILHAEGIAKLMTGNDINPIICDGLPYVLKKANRSNRVPRIGMPEAKAILPNNQGFF